MVSTRPFPPVPIWAVQILLFGALARKPDGRIKKLPTAAEDLMKSLRVLFFMIGKN
jgi:hypothetical protein